MYNVCVYVLMCMQLYIIYVKIRLMHWHMFTPLYSHCYTATCFSPQGAILREYWYILWARSTKCVSRCKYQVKEQCAGCYVAAVRAVLTYISALVGVLRKLVTSVHGYEQDKDYIFMYTRICVCVFVFVLYCRFQTQNERMDALVKEMQVTETSNEISNWYLIGQGCPPYLKKRTIFGVHKFSNFPEIWEPIQKSRL
jgi:hypothetical protein